MSFYNVSSFPERFKNIFRLIRTTIAKSESKNAAITETFTLSPVAAASFEEPPFDVPDVPLSGVPAVPPPFCCFRTRLPIAASIASA